MGSPLTQMGKKAAAQPHSPPLPTLVSQRYSTFNVFQSLYLKIFRSTFLFIHEHIILYSEQINLSCTFRRRSKTLA